MSIDFHTTNDIWRLCDLISETLTGRKTKLICLEFLRQIPDLPVKNPTIKSCFQMVEDWAERKASNNILGQARRTIEHFSWKIQREYRNCVQEANAISLLKRRFWAACRNNPDYNDSGGDILRCRISGKEAEDCNTIRHMVPYKTLEPINVSSATLELANSCYNQHNCAFALHDSLLEEGRNEYAEHFLEQYHPKGCWILDHILGKE